jgi:hypothetical protein
VALSKDVIEARIDLRVCELRVLAAKTAVDWGRAQQDKLLRDLDKLLRDLLPPPSDDPDKDA